MNNTYHRITRLEEILAIPHWLLCKFWNDNNSKYVLEIENSKEDISLNRNLHLSRPLKVISKNANGNNHTIYSTVNEPGKPVIMRNCINNKFENFVIHGFYTKY